MLILVLFLASLRGFPLLGLLILLWLARLVQVKSLMRLAGSSWMSALGPGGIFCCLRRCSGCVDCLSGSRTGGSHHFSIFAEFSILQWTAEVSCPRVTQPVWPACWVDTPDGSSSSASKVVQNTWDIYSEELETVPPDLILALRSAFDRKGVDGSSGLRVLRLVFLGAYHRAGGLVASGFQVAGGSELRRVSREDEVYVASAQCFVNSSLVPALLFRRWSNPLRMFSRVFVSTASLRTGGMRCIGIGVLSDDRVHAGLCTPWSLGCTGFLPDVHGFYKWVFDALGVLDDFVRQVVVARKGSGLRSWAKWLREDLGSRPYTFFIPDFVPAEFRKAWRPFFCRSGHLVVTVEQFLEFVDSFLPQEPVIDLPWITGQDLLEVAKDKKAVYGCGLDGWARSEIKSLPLAWFSGLTILLNILLFGLKDCWMLILL